MLSNNLASLNTLDAELSANVLVGPVGGEESDQHKVAQAAALEKTIGGAGAGNKDEAGPSGAQPQAPSAPSTQPQSSRDKSSTGAGRRSTRVFAGQS